MTDNQTLTPDQKQQIIEIAEILKERLFDNVYTIKPKSEFYDPDLGISIKNYNDEEIQVKLL